MKNFCQNCQAFIKTINNRCRQCFEEICRICGCTDSEPCIEGCEWIAEGLCSNCLTADKSSLGINNIFVCVGSPKHLRDLVMAARSNHPHSVCWTIHQTAHPGDIAVFYLIHPISAIVGFGNIIAAPWEETDSEWKDKYFTEINRLQILDESSYITNREIKTLFPEWIYMKQPRQSVAILNTIRVPFWELLSERIK